MKGVLLAAGGLCLATGLGVLLYTQRPVHEELAEPQMQMPNLGFIQEAKSRVPQPEEMIGVVIAERQVEVTSTLQGRVAEVRVGIGQRVEADQVLATLDPDTVQSSVETTEAELAAAKARMRQARADYRSASSRYERLKKLTDITSQQEIDDARAARDGASSRVAGAEAEILQAEARLKQAANQGAGAEIKAPFTGVVTQRYVGPGTQVQPGTPVARLVDDASLFVRFLVPERHSGRLQPERTLLVKIVGSNVQLKGQLRSFSPEIDADAQGRICEGTLTIAPEERAQIPVNAPVVVLLPEQATQN